MKQEEPKIIGLIARRVRAPSPGGSSASSSGTFYGVSGPTKAHYDFIVELDNGEAYKVGLVTDNPPDIAWFQEHFKRARHGYKRVR